MRTMLAAGLIAAASIFAIAAPAQAACFYNKSDASVVRVTLSCGLLCSNDWKIPKGDYNCRGGTGGTYKILTTEGNGMLLSGVVHDRGYVTITGSCNTGFKAQAWTPDHKLYGESVYHGQAPHCK